MDSLMFLAKFGHIGHPVLVLMFLRMLISLFLMVLVGSLVIAL